VLAVIRDADPHDKAAIYRELGLSLSYDHENRIVTAEATPRSSVDLLAVSEGGLGHSVPGLTRQTCFRLPT